MFVLYGGGQADDGGDVMAAAIVEKILPGILIKLISADNYGSPAPVAAGGVDERAG